ncbi:glycosyltransferase family 1 protein [Acetobacteraceae bacterium]|nr:glycosyltransferase family 1 protein [Acetobacteraceae bacterium]
MPSVSGFPHDSSKEKSFKWSKTPLKILHLGDFFFDSKRKSPSQFQTSGKINNGLIRNGHQLIPFPYREIGRRGLGKYFSKIKSFQTEKFLREFIDSACPDILLLANGVEISAPTLQEMRLKHKNLKVAQWSGDALFEGKSAQRLKAHYPFCEATFVSTSSSVTKEFLGLKKAIYFLPNPVDSSVETVRNFKYPVLSKDIFLSCGHPKDKREICGQAWEMDHFLYFLLENLPENIGFSLAGLGGKSYASGHEYAKIIQAAGIGLNLSRKGNERLYSSDRMSHIVGNGLLCAQERESGFDEIFLEEEMLFFSSKEELIEKLTYFVQHPKKRQKTAQRGWEKYYSLFNESALADYMVRAILGILRPEEHSWHLLP